MTSERKYSVYEIDRMRCAVEWLCNIGGQADQIARIREERLRTYMLNGTDPDELEREVDQRLGIRMATFSNYPQPFATKRSAP